MGSEGALIAEPAEPAPIFTQAAAFSVDAIDTTAAGDAFVGALAVMLSEGQSLTEAARFCQRRRRHRGPRAGAQPFAAYAGEVEAFLRLRTPHNQEQAKWGIYSRRRFLATGTSSRTN